MKEIWDVHVTLSGVAGEHARGAPRQLWSTADRMGSIGFAFSWAWNGVMTPTDDMLQEKTRCYERLGPFPGTRVWLCLSRPPSLRKPASTNLTVVWRDGPHGVCFKLVGCAALQRTELALCSKRSTELKALVFLHTWLKITVICC